MGFRDKNALSKWDPTNRKVPNQKKKKTEQDEWNKFILVHHKIYPHEPVMLVMP